MALQSQDPGAPRPRSGLPPLCPRVPLGSRHDVTSYEVEEHPRATLPGLKIFISLVPKVTKHLTMSFSNTLADSPLPGAVLRLNPSISPAASGCTGSLNMPHSSMHLHAAPDTSTQATPSPRNAPAVFLHQANLHSCFKATLHVTSIGAMLPRALVPLPAPSSLEIIFVHNLPPFLHACQSSAVLTLLPTFPPSHSQAHTPIFGRVEQSSMELYFSLLSPPKGSKGYAAQETSGSLAVHKLGHF